MGAQRERARQRSTCATRATFEAQVSARNSLLKAQEHVAGRKTGRERVRRPATSCGFRLFSSHAREFHQRWRQEATTQQKNSDRHRVGALFACQCLAELLLADCVKMTLARRLALVFARLAARCGDGGSG